MLLTELIKLLCLSSQIHELCICVSGTLSDSTVSPVMSYVYLVTKTCPDLGIPGQSNLLRSQKLSNSWLVFGWGITKEYQCCDTEADHHWTSLSSKPPEEVIISQLGTIQNPATIKSNKNKDMGKNCSIHSSQVVPPGIKDEDLLHSFNFVSHILQEYLENKPQYYFHYSLVSFVSASEPCSLFHNTITTLAVS